MMVVGVCVLGVVLSYDVKGYVVGVGVEFMIDGLWICCFILLSYLVVNCVELNCVLVNWCLFLVGDLGDGMFVIFGICYGNVVCISLWLKWDCWRIEGVGY